VNESFKLSEVGGKEPLKGGKFDDKYGFEESAFFRVIDELLRERNRYESGTYSNLLYKFICNAGIGAMGRGLSHKMVYDPGTDSSVPVPAGPLTNPLYAG